MTARPSGVRPRWCSTLIGALALVATAACESTTGPKTGLDTKAALADYSAMDSVFASHAWASFKSLGGRSPMSSSAAFGAMGALSDVASPASSRAFALRLLHDVAGARSAGESLSETLISAVHRGKTLTYDAASDQYVMNPARTGAPSSGTRFVLYEVDANGKPIAAQEIGYADLTDEGTAGNAAFALRLLAVVRSKTTVDYRLRVEPRGTAGTVDVSGFLVGDNNTKLEFTIGVVGTTVGSTNTVAVDFALGIPQRAFEVTGHVTGVDGSTNGDGMVDLAVQHGDHTLDVQMEGKAGQLNGEIKLDGVRFVAVSGAKDSPSLRNDAGQPLNGQELLLVMHIVDMTDDVFDLVQDLLKPVDNLLVLGWIL